MAHWQQFAMVADEFLLAYSQIRSNTPAATLFNIGHAAELYLKAAALKLDPTKAAKTYGHGLVGLLDLLHANGQLRHFNVKESIRDRIMKQWPRPVSALADPDFQEYTQNQELYWVAYYLADVKYLGSEHVRAPAQFGLMVMARNPYWVPFFKELRLYLGWPTAGSFYDCIATELGRGKLPTDSEAFLRSLG